MTDKQLAAIDALLAKAFRLPTDEEGRLYIPGRSRWTPPPPWHPTRDIALAWALVVMLGDRVTIYGPNASHAHGEYANGDEWCAEVRPEGAAHYDSVWAYAATAPLAICLAALKAKNLEVPT